ncbi:MAG: acetyl-CoA decarbonylase/synthase complex subunit gamma [Candidatus Gastranaerophilales bacterium]|nr:acetyl-CoA decarbonylase/synthase complex subunit gamma [Candidatus Gastranaerophilales bacterium]
MALTGLQIFKMLPGGKKEKEANCKKCGFPTCMAFAMKLAKGEISVDECPYMSYSLKNLLDEQKRPAQYEYAYGTPKGQVKIGGETVLFRHEKTFHNPTIIAVNLKSSDEYFRQKFKKIRNYNIERVGETFGINSINLIDDDESFIEKVKFLADKNIPVILSSSSSKRISDALKVTGLNKPIINLASKNLSTIVKIQQKFDVIVTINAKSFEELKKKSKEFKALGGKKAVLMLTTSLSKPFEFVKDMTKIRQLAMRDKDENFAYPIMTQINFSFDKYYDALLASISLCKYSNIIVLPEMDEAIITALFTLSQGLYTDPQKPLQVEAKLYEVGEPDEYSPVFVTTNFALTYFAVVTEIESLDKGAYLVITDSDGMSVLTAWSASKLTGEIIAKAIKNSDLESKIKHRDLIIPGFIDVLKDEINLELPDWNVVIGPNEAADLLKFLKTYKATEITS